MTIEEIKQKVNDDFNAIYPANLAEIEEMQSKMGKQMIRTLVDTCLEYYKRGFEAGASAMFEAGFAHLTEKDKPTL